MLLILYACCASLYGVSQAYKDQLKETYGLSHRGGYRAPRNVYNITQQNPFWARPDYEIAATILGYKPIILVPSFIFDEKRGMPMFDIDCSMIQALVEERPYYAQHENEYILYSPATRKNALLLLETLLKEWENKPGNIRFHYLFGKLVGYLERDIRLFVQKQKFSEDNRGRAPASNDELDAYIDTTWQSRHQDDYERITNEVDTYIENASEDAVEKRVQGLRNKSATDIAYDMPSHKLVPDTCHVMTYLQSVYNAIAWLHKQIVSVSGY